MMKSTMNTLPDDYQERLHFQVTARGRILRLNLAAIALMLFWGVVILGLWFVYHGTLNAPFVIESLPTTLSSLAVIVILVAVLGLHEWVHGLAMRYFGHKPRYGIKPLKGVLYATADGAYFWRNQYITVALAPFAVITPLAIIIGFLFPADASLIWMGAAILNATGAIGDFWMSYIAAKYPKDALFQDVEDGMRVFTSEAA